MYNEFHPQQHVLSREMLTFKSTSSEVTEKRPLWSTGPFWEDAFVFSSVISLVPVTVFKGRDWLRFKSIGSRRKVRHNLLRQKRKQWQRKTTKFQSNSNTIQNNQMCRLRWCKRRSKPKVDLEPPWCPLAGRWSITERSPTEAKGPLKERSRCGVREYSSLVRPLCRWSLSLPIST